MRRIFWLLVLIGTLGFGAGEVRAEPAAGPDRPLADAAQEARAKVLFKDVRCVVCQHESIAESPAGIAADMRALVREQVAAGRSDEAVREDLVRRYGDYVLFTPPLRLGTWLLWFGPFVALAIAAGLLGLRARRGRVESQALTPQEEAQIQALIAEVDEPGAVYDKTDRSGPPA